MRLPEVKTGRVVRAVEVTSLFVPITTCLLEIAIRRSTCD
jgi:hypothetical protein